MSNDNLGSPGIYGSGWQKRAWEYSVSWLRDHWMYVAVIVPILLCCFYGMFVGPPEPFESADHTVRVRFRLRYPWTEVDALPAPYVIHLYCPPRSEAKLLICRFEKHISSPQFALTTCDQVRNALAAHYKKGAYYSEGPRREMRVSGHTGEGISVTYANAAGGSPSRVEIVVIETPQAFYGIEFLDFACNYGEEEVQRHLAAIEIDQ